MITLGCDIGSLTAKAVLLKDNEIFSSKIIRVKATPVKSAEAVVNEVLKSCGLSFNDIDLCCSTGYGRYDIPYADINKSEISCHGMGAFWADSTIGTIIDIGGQDCKVIIIDENGMVKDFVMNEKCAAGTGRSLEILAKSIGIDYKKLGSVSRRKRKPNFEITNKCSIFMELEVMQLLYRKKKVSDIAYAINHAIAKRAISLVNSLKIKDNICISGGVSKNASIVKIIEQLVSKKLKRLPVDPQLLGALGASVFAQQHALREEKILNNNNNDYLLVS